MKFFKLILLSLTATLAVAQQLPENENSNSTQWTPVTLAGEFLEHDFVNFFAYADGVYDSYAPISTANGTTNNGSFGWEVGGGVQASHSFKDAGFSVSYRGDYRNYQSSSYTTGTDQNLSLSYFKRLTRRTTLSLNVGGGIFLYGGTFFANPSNATDIAPVSPFAAETRFFNGGVSISYQQSRRLSYVGSGSYFLQRYNYPGALGAQGISASGSVLYRTTARTTVGGTYSHSLYNYQRGVGQANADSVAATISHQFQNHWSASASFGVTHSYINGNLFLPNQIVSALGLGPGRYQYGKYSQSTSFPSFSGSVSHWYRHTSISASVGQGLSAGNGYYLASKTLYGNGFISHSIAQRQSVSLAAGFFRLSSVSNTVSNQYSSGTVSAGYGINLYRYFGLNASYNYIYYGNLSPNLPISDNRLTFGINFSSKSIPLTMF